MHNIYVPVQKKIFLLIISFVNIFIKNDKISFIKRRLEKASNDNIIVKKDFIGKERRGE